MDPLTMWLISFGANLAIGSQQFRSQRGMARMGRQLESEGIEANLEGLRTQSEEQSLSSIKQLRQTMGAQMAIQAARGAATNIGSAFFISQKSMGEFNRDERKRRLNLLSQEAGMRAQGVLSGLHQLQTETQLGRSMQGKLFDMLPISSIASSLNTNSLLKSTTGAVTRGATAAAKRASFGLEGAQF